MREGLTKLAAEDTHSDGRIREVSLSDSNPRVGFWSVIRGHKTEHIRRAMDHGLDRANKWLTQDHMDETDELFDHRPMALQMSAALRKAAPSFHKVLVEDRDEVKAQHRVLPICAIQCRA